jgi:hypothetical protein
MLILGPGYTSMTRLAATSTEETARKYGDDLMKENFTGTESSRFAAERKVKREK